MKNIKADLSLLLLVIITSIIIGSTYTQFIVMLDGFQPTTEDGILYRQWIIPIFLTGFLVVGGSVLGINQLYQQNKQKGRWVINWVTFITVFLPCVIVVYLLNSSWFLAWLFIIDRGYNTNLSLFLTMSKFSSNIGIFLGVYSGYIATSLFSKRK